MVSFFLQYKYKKIQDGLLHVQTTKEELYTYRHCLAKMKKGTQKSLCAEDQKVR